MFQFIPICNWLPNYKWKNHFHGDLVAGLTVGIMHVPQGVFAVASMMVGACRLRLIPDHEITSGNSTHSLDPDVTPLVLTSALTLVVGCIQVTVYSHFIFYNLCLFVGTYFQILLGLLRLGFLATYLSDPLVSGFTTGSAAHVMVSQLNKVFGVKMPRHEGMGMLIRMVRDLISSLPSTNLVTFIISVISILFLDLGRTFINPLVKKFSPIPPPLELILELYAVGIMSVVSSFFPVYPVGASLSRSSVCEMSGANTQLYTVFSSILLLTVILFLGPFLEPLPMLRLTFSYQAIWLVACLATILTDVTKGLVISLAFALITVVLREQWWDSHILHSCLYKAIISI
uniref:Sulfate_transp domain-containing protein n=1 Tax=Heterorhabditis bacteriophora TaxID=37862 RepID=A0A1I7XM25_HETBA